MVADESLLWIRDLVVDLIKGENQWEELIEAALEKCGAKVKLSNDGQYQGRSWSKTGGWEGRV